MAQDPLARSGGDFAHLVTQLVGIAQPGQRIGVGHCMQVIPADVLRRCFSRLHKRIPRIGFKQCQEQTMGMEG